MINKQNLWFVTLFSLILVLGIYYVTMADESLQIENVIDDSEPVVSISQSDELMALRIAAEEEVLTEIQKYEEILLDNNATLQEKNDAYDGLQAINTKKSKTEEMQEMIKEKFSLESVVKINSDQINIIISGNQHDSSLANEIIRATQEMFDSQMYITVKFQG